MFSPRIYWRLFESLNLAFWPLQAGIALAALAWLGWVGRDGGVPSRAAARAALAGVGAGLGAQRLGLPVAAAGADPLAGRVHRAAVRAAGRRHAGAGAARRGTGSLPTGCAARRAWRCCSGRCSSSAAGRTGGPALDAGRVRRPGQRPDGHRHAGPAAAVARPEGAAARAVGRAGGLVHAQCRHLVDHGLGAGLGAGRGVCWSRAWPRGVAEAPHLPKAGRAAMDAAIASD